MEDLGTLNIQKAERYPRATEFIEEIVTAVESLMKKGYAYRDGGRLRLLLNQEVPPVREALRDEGRRRSSRGTRVAVDHYEKMGANDFALWKAWDPDDGQVFWETRLGKGRPGWHIECSVMAMKYLGQSFDIHTGGKDLRFPHHENEIAQSEALTGKRFVKVWMHAEFLNINGEKMSKSLGNFVTLRDLVKQAWSPRAIRLFLISAHYRDELEPDRQFHGAGGRDDEEGRPVLREGSHGQRSRPRGRRRSPSSPSSRCSGASSRPWTTT